MIDSHAHLYWEDFQKDFSEVIQRAKEQDLTHIINIGVDLETSQKAVKQAQEVKDLKVFATIGFHPHDGLEDNVSIQSIMSKLEDLYREAPEDIVAIGECGLDFYSPNPPLTEDIKNQQRQLFQAQVELAKKLNLPLVIHCRQAWDEIFDYLDNSLTGVFHCWSGTADDAKRALDLGFYISFAGNLTYPKAHNLKQVAKLIPQDKLLIETDCPFLSPEGKRGSRNEPANVLAVATTLAKIRGVDLEQIKQLTSDNTLKLFRI